MQNDTSPMAGDMTIPNQTTHVFIPRFSNPTSRKLSEDIPPMVWKYKCTKLFTVALFVFAKSQNQSKCSNIGDWLNKLWHKHKMYYADKKNDEFNELIGKWLSGYIK